MNYNFILLALLCLSMNVFAQTSFDLNQQERQEILRLETERPALTPTPKTNQQEDYRNFSDNDDDGMRDSWEMQHGLNPNDPHDAWGDLDGDNVLNLFEFQLGSDASSASSPITYDFGPNTPFTDIYNAIGQAENQTTLVRLAEGNYDNFYCLKYFGSDYELMIQGGWNSTFTTYDPRTYRTILRNPTEEVVTIGSFSGVQFSTVVLDGIEVIGSGDFSLGGGISLRRHCKTTYTSIYNCKFVDNNYYGLNMTFRDQSEDATVFIANSLFGNNPRGGIYTQSADIASAEWRVYNTTIHNPGSSSDGGIDGLTADSGDLFLKLNNSINWGNYTYSFNFFSNDIIGIDVKNSSVDQVDPAVTNYTETNNINTNPLFVNAPFDDFSLTAGSPCLDAGVLLGMPYQGNAPDMGIEDQSLSTALPEITEGNTLSLFPNLVPTNHLVFNVVGLEVNSDYTLELVDLFGRTLWTKSFLAEEDQYTVNPSIHLAPALYFAVLRNNKQQYVALPIQLTD